MRSKRLWSRREVLARGGAAACLAALRARGAGAQQGHTGMAMPPVRHPRTMDARKLEAFVDPLPLPQVLRPVDRRGSERYGLTEPVPYYRIEAKEVSAKMHRDLPASRMWSYGDGAEPTLLETRAERGILIEWVNGLPTKHILPLDSPMQQMPHTMEDAPETRMIAHMHGARVPSNSDGYPEDWFGPGESKLCFYPNRQQATALWFHDHAMGVSRLNVIAGLMGWNLLRDAVEDGLGLPSGAYELPLMIYDRSFTPEGQLFYPNPPDEGAWAEEFLGDAMVVNGKVQPFHEVEARRYRLRVVNTANSRFFSLSFSNGQAFHVIGTDQGLLGAPVEVKRLVVAPAERMDLLVDFRASAGKRVVLQSDTLPLMQFRVGTKAAPVDAPLPVVLRPVARMAATQAIRTRVMTLNEFDADTGEPMVMLLNRRHWVEPVTETVKLGTTEIWSLVNLTEDTHPIHLHMVRFQILDRQSIAVYDYLADERLRGTGPVLAPAAHEMGWKDIVQCPAGTVTRIIVPFQGYAGRYLWHCHILEHEANDMMRPYDVIA